MTEQDVIESQAFKVINILIDEKAKELAGYMSGLKGRVDQMFEPRKYGAGVRTRIHCEDPRNNGREVELPTTVHDVKELQYYLDTIERLEKEIGELQRFKCRLTGDWDFTKGDTSDMEAVFGEKIAGF